LLFERYTSPFDYLDALLEYGEFGRGVCNIWDTANDKKAWELYLSYNPHNDKSFEDWKKELKDHTPQKMSKAQVDATVEKSQKILKNFKPSPEK
jgi:hypothetical protein